MPGWVIVDRAPVYAAPAGPRTQQVKIHFEPVHVSGETQRAGRTWLRVGDDAWIRSTEVRVFRSRRPPNDLHVDERWIDVDLGQQVLTAYRGSTPIFSTLVSSGRGQRGSDLATPVGEHRIWVKLRSRDMSNLENAEARRCYSIDDVPWVMFFEGGYGLHGAFWHRAFGHVRSHGCVNLAPADAETLFHWAGPKLPAGWSAVHPTECDPGTRVVVR